MGEKLSFSDIERETIVAERAAVLAFAREHGRQVDAMIAAGRLPAAEATTLKQRISCFADGIATGLHRDGSDPEGVRAALRAVVNGEAA